MDSAGKINVISVPDLKFRVFTIGLQLGSYYYGYYYSLQTMVGEEISS